MNNYTPIPEPELEIFKILSPTFKTVFDVGARDDIDYFNIDPSCEYHLFEPMVQALESLKLKISNISNHMIKVNEFGLSDKLGDNQVYYDNTQSFTPHWSIQSMDIGSRYNLRTLDDYVKTENIKHIDFLKIDVEGLDYRVILGGIKTIKESNKVTYIQVEYSGGVDQYVKLLPNFKFYWMMEPRLLEAVRNYKGDLNINFNKALIELDEDLVKFVDALSLTGAGGNIFGINKSHNLDSETFNELFFTIDKGAVV